jgi:hypothetical protein
MTRLSTASVLRHRVQNIPSAHVSGLAVRTDTVPYIGRLTTNASSVVHLLSQCPYAVSLCWCVFLTLTLGLIMTDTHHIAQSSHVDTQASRTTVAVICAR